MIQVVKPFLPKKKDYIQYLEQIWDRNWLTNNGPLLNQLEEQLKEYLGLDNFVFVTNGTVAIQIAIKALKLEGEIITTPFSFVATTSSIIWENCKAIFVDIDSNTYNIDPEKIEVAITPNTTAILVTHVFGNACDINAIDILAKKYNLKVIYDAAHCFGISYKNESIFNYGDISTTSFHATKLFHTIEGGGIITSSSNIHEVLRSLRNFGFNGAYTFGSIGINAKNSEFHAAMGLCNLQHISEILNTRKNQYLYYIEKLQGEKVEFQELNKDMDKYNYAYFPIVFASEKQLLRVMDNLEKQRISTRRYFYPPLNKLNYVDSVSMPITEKIACRILCLPLFHTMTIEVQDFVVGIIKKTLKEKN